MNKIAKSTLFLFFTILPILNLFGQNTESTTKVGTTAGQFLKIGVGARANAMGGAYVAVDYGLESSYWNPASIARIPGQGEAAFNHSTWLVDTQYDYAGFSVNSSAGTVGLYFISFRIIFVKILRCIYPIICSCIPILICYLNSFIS